MWFNQALMFHYELDTTTPIAEALIPERLKDCPPHARFLYGFMPVIADELALEIPGYTLICLGKEERILPKAVIKRFLDEKVQAIELAEHRTLGRREKSQMAEDLEFDLLPQAFCLQKKCFALLDEKSKRLIINTNNVNQASQLCASLRKALPGLRVTPIITEKQLAKTFSTWINHPETLPSAFSLASDCLLFSPDDEKKRFNCKGYALPADEILSLLAQGLYTAEISLIWQERIQFTLTHDLTFKRMKCMDYLVDELQNIHELETAIEQQSASLTLLGGEIRAMMDDVLKATALTETTTVA
jgi:recombination associated protein RdgC